MRAHRIIKRIEPSRPRSCQLDRSGVEAVADEFIHGQVF